MTMWHRNRPKFGKLALFGALTVIAGFTVLPRPSFAAEGKQIYGVVSHFLHTGRFLEGYPDYWNVDKTIPVMKDLGVGWAHEAIYAWTSPNRALVAPDGASAAFMARVAVNRQAVSDLLSKYDATQIKVVLAVLANP